MPSRPTPRATAISPPQLTKIKAANPDVIFLPAYYNDAAGITRQARQQGITAHLSAAMPGAPLKSSSSAATEIKDRTSATTTRPRSRPRSPRSSSTDYHGEVRSGSGRRGCPHLHDALGLITEAIKDAGKLDRQAVRDSLSKITKLRWRDRHRCSSSSGSGDPIKSAVILQIKDGKFVWVANGHLAEAECIMGMNVAKARRGIYLRVHGRSRPVAAQQAINAIQLGSIYALIALGYSMVYGVPTMINFAHGDLFMLRALARLFAGIVALIPFHICPSSCLAAGHGRDRLAGSLDRAGLAYRPLRLAPARLGHYHRVGVRPPD